MSYFTCTRSFYHPVMLEVYLGVWAAEEKNMFTLCGILKKQMTILILSHY